ncbi:hypothetical protein [Paenibacillus silvae]|uniref:hypothetical protein n=1 Tax=Paenibacillus silvae TaxID=1325358 RepID=UPI001F0B85A7|nr:hypothetical protein [Paenibacillus silvae]
MKDMRYSIWIEAEEWAEGEWNTFDDSTDAIVTFEDGSLHFIHTRTSTPWQKRTNERVNAYMESTYGEVT